MEKVATVFFGSSGYSLPYLDSLFKNPLVNLLLVVSQPDKPSGRGFKTRPTPTKEWAKKNSVLVLTPIDLHDPIFLGTLKTLPLNLGIVAYYGLKISKEVIDRFPLGILNVHHSLLPKHRGPNPIPWAIISGETKTGTSLMEIDENFDAGQVIARVEEEIQPDDTTGSLRTRLDQKGVALLEEILPDYFKGEIEPEKTVQELGSYEPKITKEMAKIDWNQSDAEIERKIRAFNPWPMAWTTLQELGSWKNLKNQISNPKNKEKRIKILKGHLDEQGKLMINEVQIEGKKPMGWKQFLSGYANSL